MSDTAIPLKDMQITEAEERAGLGTLFNLRVELPIPEKMTRLVAGYIGRLQADNERLYDALKGFCALGIATEVKSDRGQSGILPMKQLPCMRRESRWNN